MVSKSKVVSLKSKVVSLKRERLARLTPEERAERATDLRLWREAMRTNEVWQAEHLANLNAAVMQKIEHHIIADVMGSFGDPTSATMAEIAAGVRARCKNLIDEDILRAAIQRAMDSLYAERPELFTCHQQVVRARPL